MLNTLLNNSLLITKKHVTYESTDVEFAIKSMKLFIRIQDYIYIRLHILICTSL